MPIRTPGRRDGFSLVELLIVVGILAALIGLMLPAVQQARRAAARTATQNDLRQIGLGVASYAEARRAFPFASGRPRQGSVSHKEHTHAHAEGEIEGAIRPQSWAISILRYVEEPALAALYEVYCLACRPEDQGPEVVDLRVPLFNGRSHATGGLDFAALVAAGPVAPDPVQRLDHWFWRSPVSTQDFTGILVPEGLGWVEADSEYVVTIAATPTRPRDVTDGLSQTAMISESGDYTLDGGATWIAPRYSWPYVSDCSRFTRYGVGSSGDPLERSLKPRSRIYGGVVQVLFGDASVRPLDDAIGPAVMSALSSRCGGEVTIR